MRKRDDLWSRECSRRSKRFRGVFYFPYFECARNEATAISARTNSEKRTNENACCALCAGYRECGLFFLHTAFVSSRQYSSDYYSPRVGAPPFGLSDRTVMVSPGIREKLSKPKLKVIKTRDKRPSKIANVGRFLMQVPCSDLFSSDQSCEDKLSILSEIVNYGLDTIMPKGLRNWSPLIYEHY